MRPRAIWLWFAASLAVLLVALAWVTRNTLRLEEEREDAAHGAEVQEKVRLALWRMDAAASALLIREGARPPDQFRAFTSPSLAWTKTYQALGKDEILIPSPLLTEQVEHVHLHFEEAENHTLTSPQAPKGYQKDVAVARFDTSAKRIESEQKKLNQLTNLLTQERSQGRLFNCIPAPKPGPSVIATVVTTANTKPEITQNPKASKENPLSKEYSSDNNGQYAQTGDSKNGIEFNKRAATLVGNQSLQVVPQMKSEAPSKKGRSKTVVATPQAQTQQEPAATASKPVPFQGSLHFPVVSVGPFKAGFVGQEMVLLREVREDDSIRRQGVWLDWPELRQSLLQDVSDLFPDASLEALPEARRSEEDPLQFASLPVRLVTGPIKAAVMPRWTPFRRSLAIAWCCVLLAAAAVAALLRGTVALSERRAAFVSAVTHELRTPLTTFRLYAELLANNMLPTAVQRAEYLSTLQAEAERLSHLVENVLAYARLERGRATAPPERLTLRELIERIRPALERRATQAGANLAVEDSQAADSLVEVDVSAVEQILFNLVDNACKYGASTATEKTIHLEAGAARGMALLRVRDHGRGIHRTESRRIFRPFHKSAQQAAVSAPGVGLGLALCRKLSRAIGGQISLDTKTALGACFVLEMPVVRE